MEPAMNGGDGTNSYSKNSNYQRMAANTVKEEIDEEIYKNLDVKTLSSVSNIIRIADLGCSTGPNTFIAMQNVLEAIERKQVSQNPDSRSLEFQVFFNDRTSNDFNTLFASLPSDRHYFSVGVPGSFHGRLFPEASLHFVYTCHALHWVSKIPEEVLDKNSPAWNKGRIYYLNAPREVYNAYRSQFNNDIDNFLNARAKEIVVGGMMVILMGATPKGVDPHSNQATFSVTMDLVGSTLMEMAKEGLLSESLVDSINIPIHYACPEEIIGLVESNGHFSVEKAELPKLLKDAPNIDICIWFKHMRAGLEAMFSQHFGHTHMDDLFERLEDKLRDNAQLLESATKKSGQLFIALKRK